MPAYSAGKVTCVTPKWFHSMEEKSRPKMFANNAKLFTAIIFVSFEALTLWVLSIWAIASLFLEKPLSLTSALFLIGMLLAGALWVSNIAIGLLRIKRWAFTPALILQLLVASIGVASFPGEFGNAVIGFGLLLPALLTFVMLFAKSVREQFQREAN